METKIGRMIQQKVWDDPRKVKEICAAVGIHPSYISKVYKKKDIALGLLMRFSAVLGHDFLAAAMPPRSEAMPNEGAAPVDLQVNTEHARALERELQLRERHLAELKARIRDKDKIIKLLQAQLHQHETRSTPGH